MNHDMFDFGIILFDRIVDIFGDIVGFGEGKAAVNGYFRIKIDLVTEFPGLDEINIIDPGL